MPLLSICIPTRNRAELLKYCLDNLKALEAAGLDFEAVVLDHASTDATSEMLDAYAATWKRLRVYRQHHVVSIEQQYTVALRLSRGEYTLYLADDDKLEIPVLLEYMELLRRSPTYSAVYAPWTMYDDVESQVQDTYFGIKEPRLFKSGEGMPLFDFIANNQIYPEIFIARTADLHTALSVGPGDAYYFFPLMYALLQRGDVYFGDKAFYHEVVVTKPHLQRAERVNVEYSIAGLDRARAGLEIMLKNILNSHGQLQIPPQTRNGLHEVLFNYTYTRLNKYINRAILNKQYIRAGEYMKRIVLWAGLYEDDLEARANLIHIDAAVEAAAGIFSGMTWLNQVYIYGFKGDGEIEQKLRDRLPGGNIATLSEVRALDITSHTAISFILLVKTTEQKREFIQRGIPSGQVLSLIELAEYYKIMPITYDYDNL